MPERFLRQDGSLNDDEITCFWFQASDLVCLASVPSSVRGTDSMHIVWEDMLQMPRCGLQ